VANQAMRSDSGLDPSLLLTVDEAAILLRLGRTQTYELVMCGKIQSVKIGRRRLVIRDGLHNFVTDLVDQQGED
jgi:excisionase family DNA binding protein